MPSNEQRRVDAALRNSVTLNKRGGIPAASLPEVVADSLADKRTGTYRDAPRDRWVVIGYWNGKPILIGAYDRAWADKLAAGGSTEDPGDMIWRMFMEAAKK